MVDDVERLARKIFLERHPDDSWEDPAKAGGDPFEADLLREHYLEMARDRMRRGKGG